jgi:hypothetical protein
VLIHDIAYWRNPYEDRPVRCRVVVVVPFGTIRDHR